VILLKENAPAQVKLFKVQPAGPFILKTFAGNTELYSVRKSSWKVIQQLYNNAVLAADAKRNLHHGL